MRNSILVSNARYGVGIYPERTDRRYGCSSRINLDYNNAFGNGEGEYDPNAFCSERTYSCGAHSISTAPGFVGESGVACNADVRLTPTSPCVDAGDPGMGWLDPDGTRCDMGAYGGPGAQRFYTNPNDGPFVRDVSILQGMVTQGDEIVIQATGAVR